MLSAENILLLGSLLLFISIVASKASSRFGIPVLILFLIAGMLAGSDGIGGVYFNDPEITQFLGVIALTFILFSGGLDTKWESVRPVLKSGIALSTFGILITAGLVGLFSVYVLDWTLLEGLLLGSIVSSTDAAAVFAILRSQNVGLKGNLRPLLEFESGSNDPMAYFLIVSLIYLIKTPDASPWVLIPRFLQSMLLGGLCGYLFGKFIIIAINKIRLDIEGLYPVLVLSLVLMTFSLTDFIGGNGFLAVYIAAIILGSSNFIHKKSLMRFYDGQAWLMQIVMFVTLGLLVFPSQIVPVAGPGLLISVFLIFIARPVAVWISLFFSRDLNSRKKFFISWVGLRGAVPIIFATYPLLADIKYANTIFNLVFFISVTSVMLQGTLLPLMARWLHVWVPEKIKRRFPLDMELMDNNNSELVELDIPSASSIVGKQIVDLELPKTSLIVLIHRDDTYITANGQTIIRAGDHLLIMVDKDKVKSIYKSLDVNKT